MHSVRKCASQISSKYRIIDILINNAGIAIHSPTRQLTPEGNELHFATNYLGHFMFTNLLLDNIKKSKAGRSAESTQINPHNVLNTVYIICISE